MSSFVKINLQVTQSFPEPEGRSPLSILGHENFAPNPAPAPAPASASALAPVNANANANTHAYVA